MNIPLTDLKSIAKAIDPQPSEAALPSSLDDVILHQIARDLRLIELSCTVDDSIAPPLAGPMYLILRLLHGQSEKLTGKATFELDEDGLQHWLQRYMFYIEREIVSRAIKMPSPLDSEDLLSEIEKGILTTR
jgi:hypothetical protein